MNVGHNLVMPLALGENLRLSMLMCGIALLCNGCHEYEDQRYPVKAELSGFMPGKSCKTAREYALKTFAQVGDASKPASVSNAGVKWSWGYVRLYPKGEPWQSHNILYYGCSPDGIIELVSIEFGGAASR